MNKKVLWISLASVATLGVGGFFAWRHYKKKKENQLEKEIESPQEETKQVSGEQQAPPPHVDILENVVYLSAKWCPACKQNEETAEKLFDKYQNKVEMKSIDADSEIAKSYGFQLDLRQIPVLAFVIDGKPIHKMLGTHSLEDYEEMFQKYFPSLKTTKEVAVQAPKKVKKESKAIAEIPATSENGVSKSEAEETTSEDA
tara:strand:- start:1056 stop:1655 length:600 start_codon:yes stop_codon:yes gene_type:complete